MAAARASADRWPDSGLGEVIHGPRPVVNGLGDTVRVDLEAGLRVLSEWYVVHDGYLYAVGVLRDPETPEVEGIAQQMIDSWRWTSAGT